MVPLLLHIRGKKKKHDLCIIIKCYWFSFNEYNIVEQTCSFALTHYLGSAHPVLSASDLIGAANICAVADEDEEGFLNIARPWCGLCAPGLVNKLKGVCVVFTDVELRPAVILPPFGAMA